MDAEEREREHEVHQLIDAIRVRYGHDLRGYARASMRRRIEVLRIKAGVPDFRQLRERLLAEPAFFDALRDDLTVQVSEMFRDPDFYRALREHIVPVLRTYPHLKVWLAGCAGGEEVYSMAILLSEEQLYQRAQLYATDISRSALARAREAIYPERHAALYAANHARSGAKTPFAAHCAHAYAQIAISERLRRNVVFFSHDLSVDYALGEMQVVFCRNVLIYFEPALRDRVVAMLTQSLCRGGFLCLGAGERLTSTQLRHGLEPLAQLPFVYRMGARA